MVQLNFAVPGFSKCGTTLLCELLRKHPAIYIPQLREPGYFAENYHRGLSWYEESFAPAQAGQLQGDDSTNYCCREFGEAACKRLLIHNPQMKFIFIARHPVARLESTFREMHHSGYKFGGQADFDLGRTLSSFPNMLADSRYWSLINIYRNRVPDDRILVLFLEEFEQNPGTELRRCFEFLGVDTAVDIPDIHQQSNSVAEKMYDSRLMRLIRRNRWTKRKWEQLAPAQQQHWAHWMGLRKPFTKPVEWKPQTLARVQKELAGEMSQFLTFYGRSTDFWNWRGMNDQQRTAAA